MFHNAEAEHDFHRIRSEYTDENGFNLAVRELVNLKQQHLETTQKLAKLWEYVLQREHKA